MCVCVCVCFFIHIYEVQHKAVDLVEKMECNAV